MQGGSQISSSRGSGWKNSIIKKGHQESRIISDSKEFPSKFSPSKNVDVNPKVIGRSQILNYSHDQIAISARGKSGGREGRITKRPTVDTPKSGDVQQIKLPFKQNPSYGELSGALSPTRRPTAKVNEQSVEFLHDIKLEYIRFKQKVSKELKKLQNDIKAAIEEVMAIVQQARSKSSHMNQMLKSPSFQAPKAPIISIPPPPFDPQRATKPVGKPQMPQGVYIDTNKYRDLTSSDAAIESVLPKIKERMSKFFDLMGQLKTEINQQAMYSPVGTKTGQFGED